MALIECSGCGRGISSEASLCLNCGKIKDSDLFPNENEGYFSKLGSTIAIILVFILSIILVMISLSFENNLFALFIGVIMFFIILYLGVNMPNK